MWWGARTPEVRGRSGAVAWLAKTCANIGSKIEVHCAAWLAVQLLEVLHILYKYNIYIASMYVWFSVWLRFRLFGLFASGFYGSDATVTA